jgi:hypothetical protein
MLRRTYTAIGKCSDLVINNALIESFCIHARSLIEFFAKPGGAVKYTDSSYTPEGPRQGLEQKLHRQIAHLIYGGRSDPDWKIGPADREELLMFLEERVKAFSAALKQEHRSAGLPAGIEMIIELPRSDTAINSTLGTTNWLPE